MYYRGCKVHVIAARRLEKLPLPEKIHFSKASQHDLSALRELAPCLSANSALFADKAYCDIETNDFFKERGSLSTCRLQTSPQPV